MTIRMVRHVGRLGQLYDLPEHYPKYRLSELHVFCNDTVPLKPMTKEINVYEIILLSF